MAQVLMYNLYYIDEIRRDRLKEIGLLPIHGDKECKKRWTNF